MELFESTLGLLIAVTILVLNVFAAIFDKWQALVLMLASIALHIVIVPVMLFGRCPLSELALVYSASLFAYLLPIYIKKRRGEKDDV